VYCKKGSHSISSLSSCKSTNINLRIHRREKFASTIDGSCIKEIGFKNPIVGVVQKFPLASELEVTKMFFKAGKRYPCYKIIHL